MIMKKVIWGLLIAVISFCLMKPVYASETPLFPEAAVSGVCGENATWEITGTELTLTMGGSGLMYDFSKDVVPWASKRSKIKTIVIGSEVTTIGSYAFYNCTTVYDAAAWI